MMNKRGQIFESVIILGALFLIGIGLVFGYYIVNQFNTVASDSFTTEAKDFITNSESIWSFSDYVYPVGVVLIMISILVTFLYVPTNPVLLIIEFFVLFFVIIVGSILGNVNSNLMNSTEFVNASTNIFPITTLVNNNLGLIGFVFGLIGLVVFFMKRGEGD